MKMLDRSSPAARRRSVSRLVREARFFWECGDGGASLYGALRLRQRDLKRWREIVGADNLSRRLAWGGLGIDTTATALRLVAARPREATKDGVQLLAMSDFVADSEIGAKAVARARGGRGRRLPFEDILWPLVQYARSRLSAARAEKSPGVSFDLDILSARARGDLDRGLLEELADLCGATLYTEFAAYCPPGYRLALRLAERPGALVADRCYKDFASRCRRDGLLSLFGKYPVLGRLVERVVTAWIDATIEMLVRLTADHAELLSSFASRRREAFGIEQRQDVRVARIHPQMSDMHNGRRSVHRIDFADGTRLIYKPRRLGLEAAFTSFVDALNADEPGLALRAPRVVDCDDYGWVEFIERRPCKDHGAVRAFYRRAGAWLCLLYALGANDCHDENLVAHGEFPVLIDLETLLHPSARLAPRANDDAPQRRIFDSVGDTGMLPRWTKGPVRGAAYEASSFGHLAGHADRVAVQRWKGMNTDNMHLRNGTVRVAEKASVPRLGSRPADAADHVDDIVDGFEFMYLVILRRKRSWLAPNGPLSRFRDLPVRHLVRSTNTYAAIAERALAPEHLVSGAAFSIALDHLSRAFLLHSRRPKEWPILQAELDSLAHLDIPCFAANTARRELYCGDRQRAVHDHFDETSYDEAARRVRGLSPLDMRFQSSIIRGAFDAAGAQVSKSAGRRAPAVAPMGEGSAVNFLDEGMAIAQVIARAAHRDRAGDLTWVGASYKADFERFQFNPVDDGLYSGRSGIALFFAAVARASGRSSFATLARRAISPIRVAIDRATPRVPLELDATGIGAGNGIASIAYGLVKIGHLLDDTAIIEDARLLLTTMTTNAIKDDRQLDVMGGAAGAILGLLAVHAATGDAALLDKAHLAGIHLLRRRAGRPRAWSTFDGRPLTGFSHGAAGISLALSRLHAVTREGKFLDAAREGLAYESSVFDTTAKNWPDLRDANIKGPLRFLAQWCHGAAGIGLARLGCAETIGTRPLQDDIDAALKASIARGLGDVDGLCCGNCGRIELLLEASRRLGVPAWEQAATRLASAVVLKARQSSGYRQFGELACALSGPSFFTGTSGIGYALLRLVRPELPCVLLWE